jgi:hypothetical protein
MQTHHPIKNEHPSPYYRHLKMQRAKHYLHHPKAIAAPSEAVAQYFIL